MKEKTIYALLMTMIPGLALAAEEQDRSGNFDRTPTTQRTRENEETPITKEIRIRKEKAIESLPKTPALKDKVNQGINRRILPAQKADFFEKYGLEQEKRKREDLKRGMFAAIEQEESKLRLEKQKHQNQEQNKLGEELQRKLAENQELMIKAERSIEEQIKENQSLSFSITSLKETIEKQRQDLEESRMVLDETDKLTAISLESLEQEVITKTQNLEEKEKQLRELEKKAQDLELKAENLESELHNTKIVEQDLKSTLQRLGERGKKGNSSSFSTPPNPVSITPSVPSASISDDSVMQPSSSSILREKQEVQKVEMPNEDI